MFWVLLIASKLAFSYYIEVFFLYILRTYGCYCCCYVFLCCCYFLYGMRVFFFWLNQTNKWYQKSNYLIVRKVRNKLLFLDLVQRLSIGPWHTYRVSLCGLSNYLRNWNLFWRCLCQCIVIIKRHFTLLPIMCSMSKPSI